MADPFEEAWTFLKFAPLVALAAGAARGIAAGATRSLAGGATRSLAGGATKKVAERTATGNLGSKLLEGKEKLDAVAESPMAQNAQKVKQKLDENRQRNAQQNMQMQNDMREAATANARTGNTTTGFN